MKRFAAFLVAAVCLMGLAACNKGGDPAAGPSPEPTPEAEVVIFEELPVHSDTWEDILNEEVPPPESEALVLSGTTGRERGVSFPYRPCFVCYDNAPAKRPLSGILEADIVYEAPALEGGGTRLLALFSDAYPAQCGPVGMAAADFLDVLAEWGGMLIHEGYPAVAGYPKLPADDAGARITNAGEAAAYFFTDKGVSGNFVNLAELVPKLYVRQPAEDLRFLLAEGYPYEGADTAGKIRLPFGGKDGEGVEYVYDPEARMYLRYQTAANGRMTGAAALSWSEEDEALKTVPLYVNNLIVQYAETGGGGLVLTGAGKCEFFVGGFHLFGTWSCEAAGSPTRYYLADGSVVTLETGRTWIALYPADVPVTAS